MWVLHSLTDGIPGSKGTAWSFVSLIEFFCSEGASRSISDTFYSGTFADGEVLAQFDTPGEITYSPPETASEAMAEYACKKSSTDKKRAKPKEASPKARREPATEI